MKLRHRFENALWWLLIDVAPTALLLLAVWFLAYNQGQIDAIKLIDSLEVRP